MKAGEILKSLNEDNNNSLFGLKTYIQKWIDFNVDQASNKRYELNSWDDFSVSYDLGNNKILLFTYDTKSLLLTYFNHETNKTIYKVKSNFDEFIIHEKALYNSIKTALQVGEKL